MSLSILSNEQMKRRILQALCTVGILGSVLASGLYTNYRIDALDRKLELGIQGDILNYTGQYVTKAMDKYMSDHVESFDVEELAKEISETATKTVSDNTQDGNITLTEEELRELEEKIKNEVLAAANGQPVVTTIAPSMTLTDADKEELAKAITAIVEANIADRLKELGTSEDTLNLIEEAVSNKMKDTAEKANECLSRLDEIEQKLSSASSSINKLSDRTDENEDDIEDLQKEVEKLKNSKNSSSSSSTDYVTKSDYNGLVSTISSLTNEYSTLKANYVTVINSISSLTDTADADKTELLSQIETVSKKVNALDTNMQKSISELEEKIESSSEDTKKAYEELTALKESVTSSTDRLNDLLNSCAEDIRRAQDTAENAQSAAERAGEVAEEAKGIAESNADEISELNAKVTQLRTDVDTNTEDIETNKENISTLDTAVSTLNDNLYSRMEELEGEMTDLKKSVADGKALIASAITNKGQTTANDASFAVMAANIDKILIGTGNVTAPDVLSGKIFTNSNGNNLVGTMPNNGAVDETIIATTESQEYQIAEGYHDGNGKVTVEPQKQTDTYSFAEGANGEAADLGETNNVRYVDATNVYDTGYDAGIEKGTSDSKVGTAVAGNVLAGETFTNDSSVGIEGTMKDNGAISKTITPKTSEQSYTIPTGYHNGSGKVTVPAVSITAPAASKILTGSTVSVTSNGTTLKSVTGSMANNGALNWNPSSSTSKTIAAGYYSGGTISTANAYNAGVTAGKASASTTIARITSTGGISVGGKDEEDATMTMTVSGSGTLTGTWFTNKGYVAVYKGSTLVLEEKHDSLSNYSGTISLAFSGATTFQFKVKCYGTSGWSAGASVSNLSVS